MQRLFVILIFIGALTGVAYFASQQQPAAHTDTQTPTATTTAQTGVQTIKEETPSYTIDVDYQLSGNALVDDHIQAEVQRSIASFKNDAKNFDATVESRPYSFTGDVAAMNVGSDIVSERINLYQDTGGAHGLPIVLTLNYDAKTGETITLDRALSLTGMTLAEVSVKALAQLKQEFGESVFVDGAAPKAENYGTFLVTPYNVTFIFQAYQVVAYAAGMPEVTFERKQNK